MNANPIYLIDIEPDCAIVTRSDGASDRLTTIYFNSVNKSGTQRAKRVLERRHKSYMFKFDVVEPGQPWAAEYTGGGGV